MNRRRRAIHASTAVADWQREAHFQTDGSIRTGLGIRPEGWWRYESDRPDLADDATLDVYVHLREAKHLERAAERLRYLAQHHQLTTDELKAIADGTGACFEWRQAVLAGQLPSPWMATLSSGRRSRLPT
ncbi:MAG: hypothetical protein H0W81_03595 [Chloroflexi bacterium]|nr:hypothetical protein [Chloroflexota bacterium]